jgi:hypothetical protein
MTDDLPASVAAVAAAGVAVACCVVPVLFSAGVVTALAGIGLAVWLVILLGGGLISAGFLGLWRRHRRSANGRC